MKTEKTMSYPRFAGFAVILKTVWNLFLSLFQVRLWFLLPLVIVLLIVALILALIGATGPLAPFVYPLF